MMFVLYREINKSEGILKVMNSYYRKDQLLIYLCLYFLNLFNLFIYMHRQILQLKKLKNLIN